MKYRGRSRIAPFLADVDFRAIALLDRFVLWYIVVYYESGRTIQNDLSLIDLIVILNKKGDKSWNPI